ncbi:hypothetical protein ACSVHC_09015 [Arthrobacter sp. KNU-44]|uniref:hypothetical protein n=1 Tax=Arthrobacter sp. KNU-44 TaxID=3450744 RepID=UPI003F423F1B
MPPTEEVTLGEVSRTLAGLVQSVEKLTEKLDKYPQWPDVLRIEKQWQDKLDAAIAQREQAIAEATRRISELESWQLWAARIVIGAVILGVISAFFIFKP